MTGSLTVTPGLDKAGRYAELLPQVASLLAGETDLVANLANCAAALHAAFANLWTGFYLRHQADLVLGPFQGPIACTRIPLTPLPKGVCGAAVERRATVVVPDVELFPGHIACSSRSRSEIVVPLLVNGRVTLVLDIDSEHVAHFDDVDRMWLERLVMLLLPSATPPV